MHQRRRTRCTTSDSTKRCRIVSSGSADEMRTSSARASANDSSSPSSASNASSASRSSAGSAVTRATTTALSGVGDRVARATEAVQGVRPRDEPECLVLRAHSGVTLVDAFAASTTAVSNAPRARASSARTWHRRNCHNHSMRTRRAPPLRSPFPTKRLGSARIVPTGEREQEVDARAHNGRRRRRRFVQARAPRAKQLGAFEVEHAQMEAGRHRRGAGEQRKHTVLTPELASLVERCRGLAVSSNTPEAQTEMRKGIHGERRVAGRPRHLDRRDTESDRLGRSAREIQREWPLDMRDRRGPACPCDGRGFNLDRPSKIASGLAALCQPRDRVGREIRAMHPFSQFQRLRCKSLDQREGRAGRTKRPPARAGVRSVVRSAADRDEEAPARSRLSGAPTAREHRTRARAACEGRCAAPGSRRSGA